MARDRLYAGEEPARLRLEDRDLVVLPCERPHGVNRGEDVEHCELNLVAEVAAKDEATLVAVDLAQRGEHRLAEELLVRVGILWRRPPSPQTADHLVLIEEIVGVRSRDPEASRISRSASPRAMAP